MAIGRYTWIVEAAAMLLLACAVFLNGSDAPTPSGCLSLQDCHVDGISERVRCGTLDVFENRDRGSGRRIAIHVTVVPALVREAAPDPLVVLAGGPGQGARSYARLVPRFFQKIRRHRDIVLVDLRGTGDSSPLKCPTPQGAAAFIATAQSIDESARRCLAELTADFTLYTHHNALADLYDVIRRLGYTRVNLWGGSWGTRAALIFTARYAELVRTVTLDGAVAAGMDFPWSYPSDASRAFDRLLTDCAAAPECPFAFPNTRGELTRWLTRSSSIRCQSPCRIRAQARRWRCSSIARPRQRLWAPRFIRRSTAAACSWRFIWPQAICHRSSRWRSETPVGPSRRRRSERTFVLRVAHNRAISHIRHWRIRRTEPLDEAQAIADRRANPEHAATDAERRLALERAIRQLPLGARQVIMLLLEGLSHREIGDVLGLTEGNVAVCATRARKTLAEVMAPARNAS